MIIKLYPTKIRKSVTMKYQRRNFQIWLMWSVSVTALALISGCTNKAAQQGFERPPAPVSVTAATMQDVPTYLDAIGKTVEREVVSHLFVTSL